jgi:hypothetical protein
VKLTKYCGNIVPTSNSSFDFSNVTWEMRQYKKFIQKFYAHLYDLIASSLHVENFDFFQYLIFIFASSMRRYMNSLSYMEKIILKQMMFKKKCMNVNIPICRPKTQFTWNLCIINRLYQFHSLYVNPKPNNSHCLTFAFMVTLLSPNIKFMAKSQHVAYLHIGISC